jgi:hypothetical protein
MAVWDDESGLVEQPPSWSLPGQMLLWSDGSPAHVQMEPFAKAGDGWTAAAKISRSAAGGNRWLTLTIQLDHAVRARWKKDHLNAREHALQALAAYLNLREWHGNDLGVLYLK